MVSTLQLDDVGARKTRVLAAPSEPYSRLGPAAGKRSLPAGKGARPRPAPPSIAVRKILFLMTASATADGSGGA